jgi:hypothetical protein
LQPFEDEKKVPIVAGQTNLQMQVFTMTTDLREHLETYLTIAQEPQTPNKKSILLCHKMHSEMEQNKLIAQNDKNKEGQPRKRGPPRQFELVGKSPGTIRNIERDKRRKLNQPI